MSKTRILTGIVVGICCWHVGQARAATMRAMPLPEMVQKADLILIGTPVARTCAWNADHSRIYTRTTFKVREYLKGTGEDTLVIETPGGIVGGVGMAVPGTPSFRLKEKNLVFVSAGRRTGTLRVLGWSQGNFQIQTDARTGRETVSRNLVGLSFVGGESRTPEQVRDLEQFKEAIRKLQGR